MTIPPRSNLILQHGFEPGMEVREERRASLAELLGEAGFAFRYLYDWGDLWWHDLTVEEVLPAPAGPCWPPAGRKDARGNRRRRITPADSWTAAE